MMRGSGVIRMGIACALLFASLSLVVWRQSRALAEVRALDESRAKRVLLEAERTQLQREIQRLESRTRIVVAGSRLGLRVPSAQEIVILQEPAAPLADRGAGVQESRRGPLMAAEQR